MGYSYYILITGIKHNICKNLYYMWNGGSYGFYDHHYFVNHRYTSYTYTGKKEMGEEQSLFTYEELKAEYIKQKNIIKSELLQIAQKIGNEAITWRKLLELKDSYESQHKQGERTLKSEFKRLIDTSLVDDMIAVCRDDIKVFVNPFGELERYTKECKKYHKEGYSDIKLIFGYSP